MTDLFTFIGSVLACLALAQLNIVLFGTVKRALQDKPILGDKEIIVLPSEDEAAEGEETTEATEEETAEAEEIAELAAKVATLATEVSTLAAKKQ